ncbi:MAG: putative nitrile hydratase alpha subunit [Mycobacterium sp.]|nr:putative nitrile hydratase alpha subunit [Mycobacterium sp.]
MVRGLAIQKGLFSHQDHRRFSWAETVGPSRGSKLVAKAWTDGGPTHSCKLVRVAKQYSALSVDSAEPAPLIARPQQPGPERQRNGTGSATSP